MIELGLGLLVGIVLALTGAGGGILTVPLLIFVVGLELSQAAPIGLMAVGLAAWAGAIIGLREGVVRYKAAALMACCGVLLAPVGVWVAGRVAHNVLAVVFALVLFWVAFRAFRRPNANSWSARAVPCRLNPQTGRFRWTSRCAAIVATSGTLAGFLSGLLGVGGGFVLVPALSRFSDLPMRSVAATSLAVIGLVSISGVASAALAGSILWPVALPFSAGAIIGMIAGRALSTRLDGQLLQRTFGLIAAIAATALLLRVTL
jgi:uncharacterized protein